MVPLRGSIQISGKHPGLYFIYGNPSPTIYRYLRKGIRLSIEDIPLTFTTTLSDTEHERNALMENVYPKLREFCQKKGYEFQVLSPLLFKVIKFKISKTGLDLNLHDFQSIIN